MDIMLERVLSLIPKAENGKYVRGSKKEFAENIGYDSGDIVSMWIKGTSTSYKGKLFEISQKYNVSVEWLRGETDIKIPGTEAGAQDDHIFSWIDDQQNVSTLLTAMGKINARLQELNNKEEV